MGVGVIVLGLFAALGLAFWISGGVKMVEGARSVVDARGYARDERGDWWRDGD